MAYTIPRISSAIILVAFLFSLTPLTLLKTDKGHELSSLISQIQQLHDNSRKSSTNFTIIFSNTITTLKATAELGRVLSLPKNNASSDNVQLVISVKLPYLLPAVAHLGHHFPLRQPPTENRQHTYQSHITSPDIDPPISFFC